MRVSIFSNALLSQANGCFNKCEQIPEYLFSPHTNWWPSRCSTRPKSRKCSFIVPFPFHFIPFRMLRARRSDKIASKKNYDDGKSFGTLVQSSTWSSTAVNIFFCLKPFLIKNLYKCITLQNARKPQLRICCTPLWRPRTFKRKICFFTKEEQFKWMNVL